MGKEVHMASTGILNKVMRTKPIGIRVNPCRDMDNRKMYNKDMISKPTLIKVMIPKNFTTYNYSTRWTSITRIWTTPIFFKSRDYTTREGAANYILVGLKPTSTCNV